MKIALKLTRTLAHLPIVGVSIGQRNDRSTWRVDWQATPTQAQADEAATLIAAFDPGASDQDEQDATRRAELRQIFENGSPTAAETREAVKLMLRRRSA